MFSLNLNLIWFVLHFSFHLVFFNREITKRMNKDLPFYYWTLNERFQDDDLPSFVDSPDVDDDNVDARKYHPLQLHKLKINH